MSVLLPINNKIGNRWNCIVAKNTKFWERDSELITHSDTDSEYITTYLQKNDIFSFLSDYKKREIEYIKSITKFTITTSVYITKQSQLSISN